MGGIRRGHRHADDVKQDAKSDEQRQDQQRQQQTGVLQNGLKALRLSSPTGLRP